MELQNLISVLNKFGYEIADETENGMGYIVRKSPYTETGASLGYSPERGFYVSVGSKERTADEVIHLAAALNTLANTAKKLNEHLGI